MRDLWLFLHRDPWFEDTLTLDCDFLDSSYSANNRIYRGDIVAKRPCSGLCDYWKMQLFLTSCFRQTHNNTDCASIFLDRSFINSSEIKDAFLYTDFKEMSSKVSKSICKEFMIDPPFLSRENQAKLYHWLLG